MWHCKHSGCVWIEINSVSEWIYRHVTIINNQNDWLASLRLTYLYLFCINPFVNFIGISNDRYNRMVCTVYRIGIRVTWNSKNFVLRHGHNWYSMPVVANNVIEIYRNAWHRFQTDVISHANVYLFWWKISSLFVELNEWTAIEVCMYVIRKRSAKMNHLPFWRCEIEFNRTSNERCASLGKFYDIPVATFSLAKIK